MQQTYFVFLRNFVIISWLNFLFCFTYLKKATAAVFDCSKIYFADFFLSAAADELTARITFPFVVESDSFYFSLHSLCHVMLMLRKPSSFISSALNVNVK